MSSSSRLARRLGGPLICLCLAYLAGLGGYQLSRVYNQIIDADPKNVFRDAWRLVEEQFYGQMPPVRARTYAAIRESLALLGDRYTVFVEPVPRQLEQDRMRGAFGGIGVALWRDAKGRLVLSPHPDSPAERAGIREGDILLAVDGREIGAATTVDDVRALVRGEVGTTVILTISRSPTRSFDLTIVRDEVQVPSVTWRVLDRAPGLGYIRIESFTERTGDEVVAALQDLRQLQPTRLVLDLRDNPGGLTGSAVATASQFLQEGVVMYEASREIEGRRAFPVQAGGVATDIPIAVLVNGGTASAAEVVAGALQDHRRGPLIGEPTFGKGSVQLVYDLSDGSSLHVTSALWLTPKERTIEGRGLAPDICLTRGGPPQDRQLDAAVAYLQLSHVPQHRRVFGVDRTCVTQLD